MCKDDSMMWWLTGVVSSLPWAGSACLKTWQSCQQGMPFPPPLPLLRTPPHTPGVGSSGVHHCCRALNGLGLLVPLPPSGGGCPQCRRCCIAGVTCCVSPSDTSSHGLLLAGCWQLTCALGLQAWLEL
jgi:hypothetical protein